MCRAIIQTLATAFEHYQMSRAKRPKGENGALDGGERKRRRQRKGKTQDETQDVVATLSKPCYRILTGVKLINT